MKTLIRNCIYQGKNAIRDPGLLFWSTIYPIILATFFYTAFSGLINEEFKVINVGIEKENPIIYNLETIDIINIIEVPEEDVALTLDKKEIDGFIDKDLNILASKSGINQTVIKEIVGQIKQMNVLGQPMESYDFTVDYIGTRNQEAKTILIVFYSLIGMLSTYGVFAGIETVSLAQGNLTHLGARLNMTPLKKRSFLVAGMIVALSLNLLSNGMLLLFIRFVLKIDLFTEIKYSLLLILLGNLFGISLGIFVGASNKRSMEVKIMISIVLTLFLSFLSGMMSTDLKVQLDKNIPILSKLNPIAILTDNLYRVNLLGNTQGVWGGIWVLGLYSIALLLLSYLFLRRRNYDSL